MALTPDQMRGLHPKIARHLAEVEKLLGPHYRMTLLCRNAHPMERGIGDMLMTVDDAEEVRAALRKLMDAAAPVIVPARVN